MRVILDANVLIAAVASRGLCEAIVELCMEQHQLVLCEGLLEETGRKLRIKLKVSPPVIAEYLRVLRHNAEMFEPEEVGKAVCRDSNDRMILGLVVPGKADAIITGDKDLLVVKEYQGARILTPRSFWESNTKAK